MRHEDSQGRRRRPKRKASPIIADDAASVLGLAVNPKRAAFMLDCSLSRIYELMAQGELENYLDGRNRRITVETLKAFIARRLAATRAAQLAAVEPGEDVGHRASNATEAL
jgi:excisionase family DNA binding protein